MGHKEKIKDLNGYVIGTIRYKSELVVMAWNPFLYEQKLLLDNMFGNINRFFVAIICNIQEYIKKYEIF